MQTNKTKQKLHLILCISKRQATSSPMYVKPSVLPEDELSDCLTRLGWNSAFSCSWWHLFLPRGMYSRGSGPRLGRRLAADSVPWAVEKPGKAEIKHLLDSLLSDQPRSGCCLKGCAEADQRTCFHFWRCRDVGSSHKRPGILLWCKLLKRSRWEFFHLALTFIPRSEQRENKKISKDLFKKCGKEHLLDGIYYTHWNEA